MRVRSPRLHSEGSIAAAMFTERDTIGGSYFRNQRHQPAFL